ncbi:hypothetical protein Ait01nite_031090 [Actinoplanes italicus]|uniref:Uncharacterized protein n=2 Tax=Actinoplanes italicus TaxID=113567 RepID=A0A2T0KJ64_9ACTN|nr:hypothetical protein CLV67_103314 [Actinoplanes italicus]GIE30064.1 hypothetical protein Ait01nite_031090 [Actinoplanes italicus]
MDRRTADRLLRGDRTGHPLDEVLAAATAPGTDRELAGEAAALAAFRTATHSPAARRRPSIVRSTLARLLTLKVAAVALGTSATLGGVALTANTRSLAENTAEHQPAFSAPATRPITPRNATPVAPTTPRPSASASARPDRVAELCRDFSRHNRDDRRRFLADGRYGELVERAGDDDRDRVERFCGSRPRPASSSTRPEHDYRDDDYEQQRPDGGDQWSPRPRPSASTSRNSSWEPRR